MRYLVGELHRHVCLAQMGVTIYRDIYIYIYIYIKAIQSKGVSLEKKEKWTNKPEKCNRELRSKKRVQLGFVNK